MSPIILIVAAIFVAAGLTLIVLSFVVGRRTPVEEQSNTDAFEGAFIDQPLEGGFDEPQEPDDMPTSEIPVVAAPGHDIETPETGWMAERVTASLDQATQSSTAAYDFRVRLGFEFLSAGLYADAAEQFQTAASLATAQESKLKLYVEIGNVFRREGMHAQATAAYTQATTYTDDPLLTEHLQRMTEELGGDSILQPVSAGKED